MTRALVVEPDTAAASSDVAALACAGYIVEACTRGRLDDCPILRGRPCRLVERADVLIYDTAVAADGPSFRRFVDELRGLYGDKALVIASEPAAPAQEGGDTDRGALRIVGRARAGRAIVRVVGHPSPDMLAYAVEEALGAR